MRTRSSSFPLLGRGGSWIWDATPHAEEHQDPVREARLQQAASHIFAAFDQEPRVHLASYSFSAAMHRAYIRMRWCLDWSILLYMLLTFVERPIWCIAMPHNPCDTESYPTSNLPYIPREQALIYEVSCLSVMAAFLLLRFLAQGLRSLRTPHQTVHLVLVAAAVADVVYAYSTPYTWFRLGPFLRIAILANSSPDIRSEMRLLVNLLPGVVAISLLVIGFLLCFAFAGTLLFHSVDTRWFGTIDRSMWSLFVLLNTCNFPDLMLKAYEHNRISALYFAVFVLLGTFFTTNLIMGVVYNRYQESEEATAAQSLHFTERHLAKAYRLLDYDDSGALSRSEFMALTDHLRLHSTLGRTLDDDTRHLLFAALDTHGTNTIDRGEFLHLCSLLHVRFEEVEAASYLERVHPHLYNSKAFRLIKAVVLSEAFRVMIDVLLVLMCFGTIWESWDELENDRPEPEHDTDGRISTFWNVMEVLFTLTFAMEAALKLLVFGWRNYWRDIGNRADFIIAVLSVLMTTIVYIPNSISDSRWIRWTVLLRTMKLMRMMRLLQLPRMLRFLRIIVSLRHFRVFYVTFVTMMPPATRLFKMMFVLLFFYAALGVQLFGGRINTSPDSPYFKTLQETEFGQSGYYLMNMNDMPSALVTLLQNLTLNNWHVIVEAYVAVKGLAAWLYFLSFWVLGASMGLNIFSSFVLDIFMKEFQRDRVSVEVEGEAEVEGGEALFDATEVTGTLTGLAGKYRAVVRGYQDTSHRSKMLLDMFRREAPESGAPP